MFIIFQIYKYIESYLIITLILQVSNNDELYFKVGLS